LGLPFSHLTLALKTKRLTGKKVSSKKLPEGTIQILPLVTEFLGLTLMFQFQTDDVFFIGEKSNIFATDYFHEAYNIFYIYLTIMISLKW
jgi:hypothetical protein